MGNRAVSSTGIRAIATLAVLILAPLIYAYGLVAPLTPSHGDGAPAVLDVVGFWVLPLGMLASIWGWDRSVVGRASAALVFAAVFGSYLWVAWLILAS